MSGFNLGLRQAGGVKSTRVGAGESITGGKVISFQPLVDSTISVMNTTGGDPATKDHVVGDVFLAGATYFLPREASTLTVSAGAIWAYEL
jgi:hypothetical protein